MKERGKSRLYYFSKQPVGALNSIPKGFEVSENKKTGMPFLKKKEGGGLFGGFGRGRSKEKKTKETKPEK